MTVCVAVREQLPWFAGGDLDALAAAAVRAHLIACPVCRAEASALQQSLGALRGLGDAGAPGVDETWFASLHRSTVAAVAAAAAPAARPARSRRLWVSLAAAVLVGLGFWWSQDRWSTSVWRRAPLATPVVDQAIVVPWAGPRVELRPLGDEAPWYGSGAESGHGPGMMGRGWLRGLVDVRVPPPAEPDAAAADPDRR